MSTTAGRRQLQASWLQVRRDFFPRWDAAGVWRLRVDGRCPAHGLCEPVKRLVTVQLIEEGPDQRDMLLIHEICHALTRNGHGAAWQARLAKAATRAGELGRSALQKLLEEEGELYRRSPVITAPMVYGDAEDAVLLASGKIPSYAGVRDWIAYQLGMRSREVEECYPRLRRVYDAAVRKAERMARVQAELNARLGRVS